jgi:toxin HigB-1
VIQSFRSKETERLFQGRFTKKLPRDLQLIAARKLGYLDAAVELEELRSPPGNRLEALRGNRKGQHSIRVNDQWRICFVWRNGNAHNVEIVDYHS